MVEQSFRPREGRDKPQGPFEGVLDHLREPLLRWTHEALTYQPAISMDVQLLERALIAARVVAPTVSVGTARNLLAEMSVRKQEDFLDLIHVLLQMRRGGPNNLAKMLEAGGSVWTVRGNGLVRRVDPGVQQAFDQATRNRDNASAELDQAWREIYGRDADASDAWEHAIKAVEAALIPLVVPNVDKPTLGHVLGQLDGLNRPLWKLGIRGPDGNHSIEPLISMLRLLWPNPDRHGHPDRRQTPSLEEARGVVHLAVTIVQWARDGQIVRR